MGTKNIFLYPKRSFTFRENYEFRKLWDFLPHSDRADIIAQQLTYLAFHEWLHKNLRHTTKEKPSAADLRGFYADVDEGFLRTDILLYASICEAALYSLAQDTFDHRDDTTPDPVIACFEQTETKTERLSQQVFQKENSDNEYFIGAIYKKTTPVPSYNISFERLIRAARSLDAIDEILEKDLDSLRKDRNTIHLGEQIERKRVNRFLFSSSDREKAKTTTENLRSSLWQHFQENEIPW